MAGGRPVGRSAAGSGGVDRTEFREFVRRTLNALRNLDARVGALENAVRGLARRSTEAAEDLEPTLAELQELRRASRALGLGE